MTSSDRPSLSTGPGKMPDGEGVGYRKIYRLRTAVPGRKSIEVTFPYEVVEKEARSKGLTVGEFLNRFQAVCEYDSFEGVVYKFEPIVVEEPRNVEVSDGK